MTATAPPLIEPDETAFPPCGEGEEWARPMLRRELEVLGELAELGLRMARTIVAQATGEETAEPVIQGDLPLAFSRVSRAVRMAVLLQSKLIQGPRDEGRKSGRGEDDEDDEGPVQWEVQWVPEDPPPWAAKEAEERAERAERREGEACEPLERDDIYAAVMGRPREEVIAEIRSDLGLEAELDREARPPPLAGSDQSHAIGSDGDREAVMGAGQAHYATQSPVSDSS